MDERPPVLCVHCRRPVKTITIWGGYGTQWTHCDGYRECLPTYAAPDIIRYERELQDART